MYIWPHGVLNWHNSRYVFTFSLSCSLLERGEELPNILGSEAVGSSVVSIVPTRQSNVVPVKSSPLDRILGLASLYRGRNVLAAVPVWLLELGALASIVADETVHEILAH